MGLDGGGADEQVVSDLAVGQAASDERQDLAFAFGDAVELAPGPVRVVR